MNTLPVHRSDKIICNNLALSICVPVAFVANLDPA